MYPRSHLFASAEMYRPWAAEHAWVVAIILALLAVLAAFFRGRSWGGNAALAGAALGCVHAAFLPALYHWRMGAILCDALLGGLAGGFLRLVRTTGRGLGGPAEVPAVPAAPAVARRGVRW